MTQFLFTLLSVLSLVFSACAPSNDSGVEKQNSSTVVGNPSSYTVFPDKIVYSAVTNKNVTIDAMSRFIVLGSNLSPSDVTVRIKRNAVLEATVAGKDIAKNDTSFSRSLSANHGDVITLDISVRGAYPTLLSGRVGEESISPENGIVPVWTYPPSPIEAELDPEAISMHLYDNDAIAKGVALELLSTAPFSQACVSELNCKDDFGYALVFQCTSPTGDFDQWVVTRDEGLNLLIVQEENGTYRGAANAFGFVDFDGPDDVIETPDDNFSLIIEPLHMGVEENSICTLTWVESQFESTDNRIIDQISFVLKGECTLAGTCFPEDAEF